MFLCSYAVNSLPFYICYGSLFLKLCNYSGNKPVETGSKNNLTLFAATWKEKMENRKQGA